MKVIILTGDETRHQYFRMKMALDKRINVLTSYCEGVEKSLANRVVNNTNSSIIERLHVEARTQSELDFFGAAISSMPAAQKKLYFPIFSRIGLRMAPLRFSSPTFKPKNEASSSEVESWPITEWQSPKLS